MRSLISLTAIPLVWLLGACTPEADPTPEPTTDPPVTATVAPTADRSSPSDEETLAEEEWTAEQQAAHDAAVQYFTAHNELAKDPEADWQPLLDLTTGMAEQQVHYEFDELRANGEKRIGDAVHHILEVGEAGELEGDPFILVVACTDSADSDVVNATTGESVVAFEGSLVLDWLVGVVQEDDNWLVSTLETTLAETCGA